MVLLFRSPFSETDDSHALRFALQGRIHRTQPKQHTLESSPPIFAFERFAGLPRYRSTWGGTVVYRCALTAASLCYAIAHRI